MSLLNYNDSILSNDSISQAQYNLNLLTITMNRRSKNKLNKYNSLSNSRDRVVEIVCFKEIRITIEHRIEKIQIFIIFILSFI